MSYQNIRDTANDVKRKVQGLQALIRQEERAHKNNKKNPKQVG